MRLAPVWLHAGWIDVVGRFRRTRIGPFWHTLSLAAFVLVMGVLWSTILHQDPFQYFRYITASMIVWGLIASFITEGTGILVAGQSTALSMRFPYVAFAFAHVWRSLLMFGHQFVFYIVVMVGTLYSPGWAVFYAIPALFLITANGVWMSLLIGMICLRCAGPYPGDSQRDADCDICNAGLLAKGLLGPRTRLCCRIQSALPPCTDHAGSATRHRAPACELAVGHGHAYRRLGGRRFGFTASSATACLTGTEGNRAWHG